MSEMDTPWDGRGLPPAARARLERSRADQVRASLLPVAGAAGLAACGLSPVGEVMGCIVEHLGWQGFGCPYYGYGYGGMRGTGGWGVPGGPGGWAGPGMRGPGGFGGGGMRMPGGFGGPMLPGGIAGPVGSGPPTVTSGESSRWGGFAPYADALYNGYETALDRMLQEARALGADGVVGVRLTVDHLGSGNREFVALGTAVRSSGMTHLASPFATLLAGQDVTKLLAAGWAPAAIVIGLSVSVRHDDYATRMQAGSWNASNTEVPGYSELVTHARADARDQLAKRIARSGAEGAVIDDMSLRIHEVEPSDNHRDHVAEAVVIGTAITRFHRTRTAPTRSLSILPLRSRPADHRAKR
jgi:uncharacterized protein YbjQ (UPF0145 family)